jgi:DNA polymerase-3 subunit delta
MIIFLYGPDTYRSHQRLKQLKDAFTKKHDPSGANLIIIDGASLSVEKLNSAVKVSGLLSNKRMVVIDELISRNKKPTRLKEIYQYLSENEIPQDTILLFKEGDVFAEKKNKKRKPKTTQPSKGALLEYLAGQDNAEEFPRLSAAQLRAWTAKRFSAGGAKASTAVVDTLISLVGDDLWQLSNEIEKLSVMRLGENITARDVAENVTGNFDANIFALTDALGNKDSKTALKILHEFLDNGEAPLYLLTMLARQFRILVGVIDIASHEPNHFTIAKRLGLHPFVAQKAIQQVGHFGKEELASIYQQLVDLDYKLKTTSNDPALLFDQFIISVCR